MKEEFVDELCAARHGFQRIVYFAVAVLALMLLWLPFTESNSPTQVVVVINIVGATAFVAIFGYVVWRCEKRVQERREQIR